MQSRTYSGCLERIARAQAARSPRHHIYRPRGVARGLSCRAARSSNPSALRMLHTRSDGPRPLASALVHAAQGRRARGTLASLASRRRRALSFWFRLTTAGSGLSRWLLRKPRIRRRRAAWRRFGRLDFATAASALLESCAMLVRVNDVSPCGLPTTGRSRAACGIRGRRQAATRGQACRART